MLLRHRQPANVPLPQISCAKQPAVVDANDEERRPILRSSLPENTNRYCRLLAHPIDHGREYWQPWRRPALSYSAFSANSAVSSPICDATN
jgi:hypothetical protein